MAEEPEASELARLRVRLRELEARFADHAASAGVPVQVVADAAAMTFDALDVEQQVELIEESLARWGASKKQAERVRQAPVAGTARVLVNEDDNALRDDLVYRLQHERFDLVFAIAVRLPGAPEGEENSEWLLTVARPGETQTPRVRHVQALELLVGDLRRAKRRYEDLRIAHVGRVAAERRKSLP